MTVPATLKPGMEGWSRFFHPLPTHEEITARVHRYSESKHSEDASFVFDMFERFPENKTREIVTMKVAALLDYMGNPPWVHERFIIAHILSEKDFDRNLQRGVKSIVNKIADSILCFDGKDVKYYDYGYENYLEKRDEEAEKEVKVEQKIKEKKTYINPLKEKEKVEKKITKLEEKIMIKENEKESLQSELLREEIYTDYVKVGDINSQISKIDEEINTIMTEWEELNEELDNIKKEIN